MHDRGQETSGHVHSPGPIPEVLVYQFHGKIRNSCKYRRIIGGVI
jgi:hypothetical protein